MKTKTFFSGLLAILFLFGLANADVKYPNYVGHINDFAKILPADTVKKLETELRKYKDQTGIEIAAVTVVSLEGLSVEEYTIGLAKKWGVGSKKKDDGVVLLVAPNERKVRIEVGYGLEPDLTDSQAGRVIRDQIIPLFKEGRMADGVVAGVAGILAQLGDMPYKAREEERAAAAERKRVEDARSAEALKNFLFIAGIILLSALVVWGFICAMGWTLAGRRKLQKLHAKNAELLATCKEKIDEAEREFPLAQAALLELKKDNAKEVWAGFEHSLSAMPAAVLSMKEMLGRCRAEHEKGSQSAETASALIYVLCKGAETHASLLEMIKDKINAVKKAKKDAAKFLSSIPNLAEKTRKVLDHPDVGVEAGSTLKEAEKKFAQAERLAEEKLPNWPAVLVLLTAAGALVASSKNSAEANKAEAEKARREGPKLLNEMPDSIEKTAKKVAEASAGAKNFIESARAKFKEAQNLAGKTSVNWLIVFALLIAASDLLKKAVDKARAEEEAEEEEKEEERRKRRRQSYSSSSSSSWSSGNSSSSDSGGGFGGFGGGGFGGGGASGSW